MNTGSEHILPKAGAATPLYSITPFTLLDYPDRTACILWFAGCNMRCVYCYNPDIVLGKGKLSFTDALKFIHSRKGLLDGVVLSGGECTMHRGIENFLAEIKKAGMLVKIDTNGSKPALMKKLIEKNLVDYVALDYKATRKKFSEITKSTLHTPFLETLTVLLSKNFPFEVRTTIHSSLLSTEDLQEMAKQLYRSGYRNKYYLQHFLNDSRTLTSLPRSEKKLNPSEISGDLEVIVRN